MLLLAGMLLKQGGVKSSVSQVKFQVRALFIHHIQIVTESTKTGLIAYRQVLRKAGFNYSKCGTSPMAEAKSIEVSHIIQQCHTFKPIL